MLFLYARLQTGRVMVWWCLSVRPSVRPVSVRPVSVRPTLRPVRPGLCPPVFHTFLQHALTYWAEILHMTFFYCTTDQVRVSSICVNCLWELCPFWNLEYLKYTVFRSFFQHALTYWAEILHIDFFFYCTTDQVWVSSICVNFWRSYAPFGT